MLRVGTRDIHDLSNVVLRFICIFSWLCLMSCLGAQKACIARYIRDLVASTVANIGAHHLSLSFNNQAVIELADHTGASAIFDSTSLLRATKLDLLVGSISCSLWIHHIASHDLVSSHHDVRTLGWSNTISTVAL